MFIINLIMEIIFAIIRGICYIICWAGIIFLAFLPLYLAVVSNALFFGLYGVYIVVIIFCEYLYMRRKDHGKTFR